MSNDQPAAGEGTGARTENRSASATKPAGISAGRIVTWLIIASLATLTGLEAVAKFGYDGTLQALEELNLEAADSGVELTEIERHVSGWTSRQTTGDGRIVIRWRSLLKDYEVQLSPEPGQTGRIASFETSNANVVKDEAPSLPDGFVPSGLPPDPTSASTGGPGGPPPGPPAGRRSGGGKGSGSSKVLSAPDQPKKFDSKKTPSKN